MRERLTTEEFIEKAKKIHGDKYDYSNVRYVNSVTKVCIVCPIHGDFWQIPNNHIRGVGCPICGNKAISSLLCGVGKNDVFHYNKTLYRVWKSMLCRCYGKENYRYGNTKRVCDEWLRLSSFKVWFDMHYIEGWHLDKDVLIKGNNVYSPSTCCFLPPQINCCISRKQSKNGLPCGVYQRGGKYRAKLFVGNSYKSITCETKEEAFEIYKKSKEKHIKSLAEAYKSQLEKRVYEALCNYKVEITD